MERTLEVLKTCKGRQDFIDTLVNEGTLTRAGAATYWSVYKTPFRGHCEPPAPSGIPMAMLFAAAF